MRLPMSRWRLTSSPAVLLWAAALLLQCANYDATQGYAGYLLPLLLQPGPSLPDIPAEDGDTDTPATQSFVVSVTVTGLTGTAGTLTLQNNGGDDLNLTADGTTAFATAIVDGDTYNVTVSTQPGDRTCAVASGSGTIAGSNVSVTVTCSAAKRIWITNSTFQGNIGGGGLTAADTACNNAGDANWPGSGTYKAMLVQSGLRIACTNANCSPSGGANDWAFAANTSYVRAGTSTAILTTDANGIFVFGTLSNSFGTTGTYWTGLNADWTISTLHCSSWTSTGTGGAANQGERGDATAVDANALSGGGGSPNCSNTRSVLCVEQ